MNAVVTNNAWYSNVMFDDFDAEQIVLAIMSDMRVYSVRDIVIQLGQTSYTDQERNDIVNMFNKMGASSALAYVGENRFRLKIQAGSNAVIQQQGQNIQSAPTAINQTQALYDFIKNEIEANRAVDTRAMRNRFPSLDSTKLQGFLHGLQKRQANRMSDGEYRTRIFKYYVDGTAFYTTNDNKHPKPQPVSSFQMDWAAAPLKVVEQRVIRPVFSTVPAPKEPILVNVATAPQVEVVATVAKKQYSIAETIEIQAIADEHFAGDIAKAKKIYETHKQLNA